MANSADPDQLASLADLNIHCLQMQGISGFSRTRVNIHISLGRFNRRQIYDTSSHFPRKQALIFHANCLQNVSET